MFKKEKVIIKVDGMKCIHCKEKVENTLMKEENIKKVKVSLDKKIVEIYYKEFINLDIIKKIIIDLGYDYQGTID